MTDFFEFLQYDFLRRAFILGIAISLLAPALGLFLIVRKYAHVAHTLAHTSVLGVALGLVLEWNITIAALIVALLSGLLMELLRQKTDLSGEVIHSIFLSVSVGLTSILASTGFNRDVWSYLFGSISTVTESDFTLLLALSALMGLVLWGIYRPLYLLSLDEEIAGASGIRSRLYDTILMLLTAFFVSLSIQIIGGLLIGALIVLPVAASMQVARGFFQTILLGMVVSTSSVIIGMTLAYHQDWPAGGTIVLVATLWLIISLLLKRFN